MNNITIFIIYTSMSILILTLTIISYDYTIYRGINTIQYIIQYQLCAKHGRSRQPSPNYRNPSSADADPERAGAGCRTSTHAARGHRAVQTTAMLDHHPHASQHLTYIYDIIVRLGEAILCHVFEQLHL